MNVTASRVGAVVVDSLQFSQGGTLAQAQALRSAGVDAVALYLGVARKTQLQAVLDAGMGALFVTLASEYLDGANDEIAQLRVIGAPKGSTVFADMEGLQAHQTAAALSPILNTWSKGIVGEGHLAGLYVGSPQGLTSGELWRLPNFTRYWKGQGSTRDRNGDLAEPDGCGWCLTQMYPSVTAGGILVDYNMVGQDYRGRVPSLVTV